MGKHTPNERWKVVEEHQYDQMPNAAQLIETAGGDAVAVMIDTDDSAVCDARAKLAAAAPELAAAMAETVKYWEMCKVKVPAGLLSQARAALAKAGAS